MSWEHHEEPWRYEQGKSSTLLTILTRASQHLMAHARDLTASGTTTPEFQLAVILAQSACELQTEEALGDLVRPAMSAKLAGVMLSRLRSPVTLADQYARDIWQALTDDPVRGETWWESWKTTRELRNEVAHSGKAVSQADAANCLARASEYTDHLSRVVAAKLRP